MAPTTVQFLENIRFIQKEQKYIEIADKKYNQNLNKEILQINDYLGFNILFAKLEDVKKRIEELQGIDYIDVTGKTSILREELSAIILEEKNPMIINDFKKNLQVKTKLESATLLRKQHPEIFDKNNPRKTALEKSDISLIKNIGKEPGE